MREITYRRVAHIESEPGDMTRYSYIILNKRGHYIICPNNSEFPFPKYILQNEVNEINTLDDSISFLNKNRIKRFENVNPHTLLECANGIREILMFKE